MFFDQVPPDTSVYMIAGYVIFFVITAIYVASLFVRTQNLDRDLETLKELEEEQSKPAAAPTRVTPAAASRPRKAPPASARPAAQKKQKQNKPAKKGVKKR